MEWIIISTGPAVKTRQLKSIEVRKPGMGRGREVSPTDNVQGVSKK